MNLSNFVLLLSASAALSAQAPVLWRDPGAVEKLDLVGGPGGRSLAPKAPFRFLQDDSSGTNPKVVVRDAAGRQWTVKFGEEVKAETFASRIAWAAGYYAEPVYYVPRGRMSGVKNPGRADRFVDKSGHFREARFELRNSTGKYLHAVDWTWEKNPFTGSHQLNGLKTVLMLTSNWDNKDGRDRTSNTGIFQRGSGREAQWVYLVTDWGGSMGKWGNVFTRGKWDCEGYREQSKEFIKEVEGGELRFGFNGQHDGEFKDDIRIADVRWLLQYLGKLTDPQIRSALRASGATAHEQDCFARALRTRLRQLHQAAYPTYRARTR